MIRSLRGMLRFPLGAATAAALTYILMASAPVDASVVIALDLQELTAEADRIVVGQVVWSEPIRVANGTIRTRYRVQVEQDLRGSGDREIIVETLGGQIGRLGMRVAGAPSFALGDRAVVFVREDGDAIFQPVGMAQGVMRVERENGRDMVVPSRRGMLLLQRNEGAVRVKGAGPLAEREPLDLFLSRVRTIIEAQRGQTP
jgi:hypothetical protein